MWTVVIDDFIGSEGASVNEIICIQFPNTCTPNESETSHIQLALRVLKIRDVNSYVVHNQLCHNYYSRIITIQGHSTLDRLLIHPVWKVLV